MGEPRDDKLFKDLFTYTPLLSHFGASKLHDLPEGRGEEFAPAGERLKQMVKSGGLQLGMLPPLVRDQQPVAGLYVPNQGRISLAPANGNMLTTTLSHEIAHHLDLVDNWETKGDRGIVLWGLGDEMEREIVAELTSYIFRMETLKFDSLTLTWHYLRNGPYYGVPHQVVNTAFKVWPRSRMLAERLGKEYEEGRLSPLPPIFQEMLMLKR